MNRKTKIITSVVGIVIVTLILLGLTYAYFLTRINGNTNDKSISVTTANLELTYNDGADILGENQVIVPGETLSSKTFTVTNSGNAKVDEYGVVIEDFAITYATTSNGNTAGDYTYFERPEDLEITIDCTSSIDNASCGSETKQLPTTSDIIYRNSIEKNEVQTYEVTITYKEANTNQSTDMNKTMEGKFNIIGTKGTLDIEGTVSDATEGDYVKVHSETKISPLDKDGHYKVVGLLPGSHSVEVYSDGSKTATKTLEITKGKASSFTQSSATITDEKREIEINGTTTELSVESVKEYIPFEEGTLAHQILINSKFETNGTIFVDTSNLGVAENTTIPGQAASLENEKILSTTKDDLGTSYYFRGNVQDNYVNFAGMCWRIVRIEGDGSVKLILEDSYALCNDTASNDVDSNPSTVYTGKWLNEGYDSSIFGGSDYVHGIIDFLGYTDGFADLLNYYKTELAMKINPSIGSSPSTETVDNTLSTKLKVDEWCYDDSVNEMNSFTYGAYTRIFENKQPSLKCAGTKLTKNKDNTDMYVGTLTADEILFAGASIYTNNSNYYLMNSFAQNGLSWWTLSPLEHILVLFVDYDGSLREAMASDAQNIRPSVSLKPSVHIRIDGTGTIGQPYVIEID